MVSIGVGECGDLQWCEWMWLRRTWVNGVVSEWCGAGMMA